MDLVIVRNQTGSQFHVPIPPERRNDELPTGLSIHPLETWQGIYLDSAANRDGQRLDDALESGDLTVEHRTVDLSELPDRDVQDLANDLLAAYERTEPIHSGMRSSWEGVAKRFGGRMQVQELSTIANGKWRPDDAQRTWLRAVSVVVTELFELEAATAA